MKRPILGNSRFVIFCCAAMLALTSCYPLAASADDFSLDVSPNIVNIASERLGEIRIFTDMRYSEFISNGSDVFIYINESEESIETIRTTRDSRGNLILKFDLEDLLALGDALIVDDYNHLEVVVVHEDGEEYTSQGEAYLIDKQSR